MTVSHNVLIIGPSWVGDMVMAQSLFIHLKHQYPNSHIDVLAPAWSLPLLKRMSEVNQGIASPFAHKQFRWFDRRNLGKQLRQHHYQQAIVLPNSWKSALVPFWAKIPQRTGWSGEQRWGLLNDVRRLDKAKLPLMIQRFVCLGLSKHAPIPSKAHIHKPRFSISAEQIAQALQAVQLQKPSQPVLALCPGAEFGPAKRWPETHYAQVAQQKLNDGWLVWLFGSANDREVCEQINQATANCCTNLAGKTTLSQAIDLLSLASAVVSNDSGLMHIAAALDKDMIVLYGSSSPAFTPPLSDKAHILSADLSCSPCFKRHCPLGHLNCLKQLSPQRVLTTMPEKF